MKKYKSTTVCAIIHNGQLAIGADGQATMGNTVAKSNVKNKKITRRKNSCWFCRIYC